jgi:plasmid stability protein
VGSITIRNIDEAIKRGARLEGVKNSRSMEAEIKALLERTYRPAEGDRATRIRAMSGAEFVAHLVAVANGADVETPARRDIPCDRDIFGAD